MSERIAVEVIGGPMDGLRSLITGKGSVGRKVGNALSLALDDEISGRHLEIVKEGHDWCARDLNSTNGTWLTNEKLQPGHSYPLKMQDVLLLGSTVLLVDAWHEGEANVPFTDFSFNDPRTYYTMTPGLGHVWNQLYLVADEDRTGGFYCDIDRLFVAMMESAAETNEAGYACVAQVKTPSRYQILAPWLQQAPAGIGRSQQMGALTVASRVWKVLNLVAERKNGAFGIGDILGAILEEGGSLAARYMRKDAVFMEDFGAKLRRGASDRTVIDIVRTARKGGVTAFAGPPDMQPGAEGQPAAATFVGTAVTMPPMLTTIWQGFAQRLERLVTGFLADAVNPLGTPQGYRPPGLEKCLADLLAETATDPAQQEQRVKQYMDSLYNLLVVILASQHDGYKVLGDTLCEMLAQAVSDKKDNRSLLQLGKSSIDIDELETRIKAVRRQVETDGINEDIVRGIIRKKLQQLG